MQKLDDLHWSYPVKTRRVKQLSCLSKHISGIEQPLLIIYTWIVRTWTLCVVYCMFSQLIRESLWTDFVQMASYWCEEFLKWHQNLPNPDLIFKPTDLRKEETQPQILIFFRNIFYRWCQRWNVQSVGPKERFFINRDKQQTKNNFFLSIYM